MLASGASLFAAGAQPPSAKEGSKTFRCDPDELLILLQYVPTGFSKVRPATRGTTFLGSHQR